jgi:hypothetical protein
MPILKNFCFCISLPTGALFVGGLESILGFIWVVKAVIRWFHTETEMHVYTKNIEETDVENDIVEQLVVWEEVDALVNLMLAVVFTICSVLLVVGTKNVRLQRDFVEENFSITFPDCYF